jgi:hypothetical protein
MAKIIHIVPGTPAFSNYSHAFLFANEIAASYDVVGAVGSIQITTNVEAENVTNDPSYALLADDSQSERSVDIATGKFVAGNLIAGIATMSEIQSDVMDYVAYPIGATADLWLFKGVCSTTQSQDYTPAILQAGREILMVTPAQVKSLGL